MSQITNGACHDSFLIILLYCIFIVYLIFLPKDDDEKRYFSLKEAHWFCLTSLAPAGGGEAPKHLSGKLIAGTWWLFCFIIVASFTGNLSAFLAVSRLEEPIRSLDELNKQYKIKSVTLAN